MMTYILFTFFKVYSLIITTTKIALYGSILGQPNSSNLAYVLWNLPDDDLSKVRNM
jgi:hypothetical protein